MREKTASIFVLMSLLMPSAHAAILGDKDSRIEMYQLPADWKSLAGATVAFSTSSHIVNVHKKWKTFSGGSSLKSSAMVSPPVHPQHRFADQPDIMDCTGVMITQDIMLTAAHCMPEDGDMSKLAYTVLVAGLGYESEAAMKAEPMNIAIDEINISTPAQILYMGKPTGMNGISDTDYAIVKLKKPFLAVNPVTLQRGFKGDYQTPVSILGYQLGLPLKADLEGKVATATDSSQKVANMFFDTGGGNSGGPIFDTKTKALIGILSGGVRDWLDCDPPSDSGIRRSQYSCEANRIETVEQLEADKNATRKIIKQFWQKYPSGVVTAWASRVIRVDQIMDKLTELGIQHQTLEQ